MRDSDSFIFFYMFRLILFSLDISSLILHMTSHQGTFLEIWGQYWSILTCINIDYGKQLN